ncbi:kinesin-like protein KIN-14S [Tanacetum coccineum]
MEVKTFDIDSGCATNLLGFEGPSTSVMKMKGFPHWKFYGFIKDSLFVMCHGHEGCSFVRHQIMQMSRSEHAVVDDAGEDDGTEKKKKYFKRLPRMILNGYVRRDTYRMKKDNGEKIYRKLDSCLVIPPPKGRRRKPLLMLTYGLPSDGLLATELVDLPLYSVGHSNGALFQVLSRSYFSDKLPKVRDLESHLAEERKIRQKQENRALAVASSHPSLSSLKQDKENVSRASNMKPITRARRGSYVVTPASTVTSQVLKRKRRASITSFQSNSSSSAMTTPINQSSAAPPMRNDRVMGQSNEAASSSHAAEAAPVAAPRSNKFMGSPPSHVVGSWKTKHPTVVVLQRKQLVWNPLKNKGIKTVRKSFVPS